MGDLEYIGPLYMGENFETVDMVYDTGSDWLVVASHDCKNCNGRTYDHSDEKSFKPL